MCWPTFPSRRRVLSACGTAPILGKDMKGERVGIIWEKIGPFTPGLNSSIALL